MGQSLELLTKSVLEYTSTTRPVRFMAVSDKEHAASSLGLKLVSTEGSYSMVVAEHPDMPGVVVKVVPKDDRFVGVAKWIMEHDNPPACFPAVTAVVELPEAFMIVVEKINHPVAEDCDEVQYVDNMLCYSGSRRKKYAHLNSMLDACYELQAVVGGRFDSHPGNFMRRDDGTLVFIDPLWA